MLPKPRSQRLYWFLALPVVIFIVAILWLINDMYKHALDREQMLKQAFELEYLHSHLLHLGELLPLTLHAAIVQGQTDAAADYQRQREKLNAVVRRLQEVVAHISLLGLDAKLAGQIEAGHLRLRAIEDQARRLYAEHELSEALAKLQSAEYIAKRSEFIGLVTQLAQEVEHGLEWVLGEDTRRVHSHILSLLVLVLLLAAVWFVLLQRTRQAHRALDLTEQELRLQKNALQESSARISAIHNNVIDGIVTIDEHGIIESVNPAMEKIFGYSEAELLGHPINMLMPAHDAAHHDGYLRHYLETGEQRIIGIGREVTGRRKDGREFALDLAVSEMYFGQQRMFSGLIRDISQHSHSLHE